ncbi:MAG: outer membrane exchange protein TraA family protein [Polyangia bacterium]
MVFGGSHSAMAKEHRALDSLSSWPQRPSLQRTSKRLRAGNWALGLWLTLGALVAAGSAEAQQQLNPITIDASEEPIAPPPLDDMGQIRSGQGLCGAFRADPNADGNIFRLRNSNYPSMGKDDLLDDVNRFMDGMSGSMAAGVRSDGTLETAFDLTNNTYLTNLSATGDYSNTPGCPKHPNPGVGISMGCDFPPTTKTGNLEQGFATRFRGFINIRPEWVKQQLHFGFFTDDAVSAAVWAKKVDPTDKTKFTLSRYTVISRGAAVGKTQFRVSNGITFPKAGLYPIEVVHVSYDSAAILEFAVLPISVFNDLDETPNVGMPLPSLGFSFEFTQPKNFFQTASGALSYDGQPSKCKQCPRNLVNQSTLPPGTCDPGMYCNEAALCSPCVGDKFCGKSCKECTAPEPFCVRDPTRSDPDRDYTCVQCRDDGDCSQGLKCVKGQCKNPCNCCPDAPHCVVTDPLKHPDVRNCSECRTDSDCGEGRKCDLINARCVTALPDCREDNRCGAGCVNCPEVSKDEPNGPRPYCLYGQVCAQCRFDYDCKAGTYCRSGDCVPCTHDRHCGPSCKSCGLGYEIATDGDSVVSVRTDRPYCLTPNGQVEAATCVRCLTDSQCGAGGKCNPSTHECENKCQVTCPAGQLCDGSKCVECLTSSQCPCGQCQDGACTATCADTSDCNSTQCCQKSTGQCVREKCGPGSAAGGALCCGVSSVAPGGEPVESGHGSRSRGPLLALLGALGLLGALRLRRARRGPTPRHAEGG